MTDLEMTKLCAEAMGLKLLPAYPPFHTLWSGRDWNGLMLSGNGKYLFIDSGAYDPLHNDAQAMALVKKFHLCVQPPELGAGLWHVWHEPKPNYTGAQDTLNRAIVECVAKLYGEPRREKQ